MPVDLRRGRGERSRSGVPGGRAARGLTALSREPALARSSCSRRTGRSFPGAGGGREPRLGAALREDHVQVAVFLGVDVDDGREDAEDVTLKRQAATNAPSYKLANVGAYGGEPTITANSKGELYDTTPSGGTILYKSTNHGSTWTQATTADPPSGDDCVFTDQSNALYECNLARQPVDGTLASRRLEVT
jgi:hypothetical protein